MVFGLGGRGGGGAPASNPQMEMATAEVRSPFLSSLPSWNNGGQVMLDMVLLLVGRS